MIENLLRNWEANSSINLVLLKELPEDTLGLSADKGARAIGDILMHMTKVRSQWLKAIAPDFQSRTGCMIQEVTMVCVPVGRAVPSVFIHCSQQAQRRGSPSVLFQKLLRFNRGSAA
jgi:DinB family protein